MEGLDTGTLVELLAHIRARRMQYQREICNIEAQLEHFAGELSSHYLFIGLLTRPYS